MIDLVRGISRNVAGMQAGSGFARVSSVSCTPADKVYCAADARYHSFALPELVVPVLAGRCRPARTHRRAGSGSRSRPY